MNRNNKGIFRVTSAFMDADMELTKVVLSNFLIVRCEYEYIQSSFIYHAYSEKFRELKEGETVPNYELLLSESGEVTVVESI